MAGETLISKGLERTAPPNLIASWRQMPELSFAVGEEDVLVLEAEACGFDAKSGSLRALFAPPFAGKLEKYGKVDSKDIERPGTDGIGAW